MPRVPVYGEPQVQERALPTPRMGAEVSLEALGGGASAAGLTDAAKGLGKMAFELALEEKKKADQLAVLDADRKASELETSLLYAPPRLADGTANPKPGAMNKTGKSAFGLPDEVPAEFEKGIGEIEKGLSGEDQRLAFRRLAATRATGINRQIQEHVSRQIASYDNETTESYVAGERDAAAYNFGDPERISLAIAMQKAAIADHAQRRGLPPEWTQLKQKDAESKTHIAVMDRLIAADQYDAVREYYKANAAGVAGMDAAMLDKAIKMSEERRQKELYIEAAGVVEKQPGVSPRLIVPGWDRLSLEQRKALEYRSKDVENDDERWLDFLALPARRVAALDRTDFETKYWTRFDRDHRAKAEAQWNAAKEAAGAGKDGNFKSIRSDHEMVMDALREVKVIPEIGTREKLTAAEAQSVRIFEDRIDGARAVYFHRTGKNPDDAALRQIIHGELLRKVRVGEWGRDPQRPAAVLTEDQIKKSYVPISDVPAADRMKLVNLARAQGRVRPEVRDEQAVGLLQTQIERAYAAALAGASGPQLIAIINED